MKCIKWTWGSPALKGILKSEVQEFLFPFNIHHGKWRQVTAGLNVSPWCIKSHKTKHKIKHQDFMAI